MDLKFSFSGAKSSRDASHDHDGHAHGAAGAAGGIPLPFAGAASAPLSSSSVLELRVSLQGETMICEGVSGDGVTYARAEVSAGGRPFAHALRSALARAGAELPEPLLGSVTAVVLDLDGREAETLEGLGLAVSGGGAQLATVDEMLQARTGISAGTPVVVASA